MSPDGLCRLIDARDLTPIDGLTAEDEDWVRDLAQAARCETLAVRLSRRRTDDAESVAWFDERTGKWWAGRYIGEVRFRDRVLRILPRFGMPQLERWLSRIWGIQLLSTKGRYERSRVWLWLLLVRLWEARLLAAAKHGLPTHRKDSLFIGNTVRGRLHVPLTAEEIGSGRRNVVSRTRNRIVDRRIGGVILHAFGQFRRELHHLGDERTWLTQRGQCLIGQLQTHISRQESVDAAASRLPIRYTPITDAYRPVVELSRAIAQQSPSNSTASGSRDVFGVLIDMAEVWELYLYHLLRSALRGVEVIHAGREVKEDYWLLHSEQNDDALGRLKPDILVLASASNRPLLVLDAKYKITTPSADRPRGIVREDLYQLVSYLSAFGRPTDSLGGGLIYPSTPDSTTIHALQERSPWRLAGTNRRFWFHGMRSGEDVTPSLALSPGEVEFIDRVADMLRLDSGKPPA